MNDKKGNGDKILSHCVLPPPPPPLPPTTPQEYEERLARLRADYEAEQESRARLEEDITAMRNSYDVKLSTLEESLRKETGGRLPRCQEGGQPAFFLVSLTDMYRALSMYQEQFYLLLTAAQRCRYHNCSHFIKN